MEIKLIGSLCAKCKTLEDFTSEDVVQSDFELIAFDFVSSPSTPGAYLFKESKQWGLTLLTDDTTKILKPGGRIIHIEGACAIPGAYLMFSPEWFFSYYSVNNFVDCKVYVTIAREEGITPYIFDTDLFAWAPFFIKKSGYKYVDACKTINGLMHVLVVAEKGKESTDHINPIQMQYLDDKSVDWRNKYYDFQKTDRPLIELSDKKENVTIPFMTEHYKYLGSKF